jgi:complement component 1 Q subcomponent-binding protein
MKSRPSFTIEIKKDGKVLSFGCSFLPAEENDKSASEDFQIDEFSIHEGEWNDKVYSVDCTVLDGQLYDILLNLLEERGMGENFANELCEFSTSFEHLQYVGLLEKLKDFSK